MSGSYCVKLIRDKNDDEYRKMLAVLLACQNAGVQLPDEVDMYFGGYGIDNDPEYPLEIDYKPKEWKSDYADGYEIDINDLPDGVSVIRFIVSY